jgi:hypothetical protein
MKLQQDPTVPLLALQSDIEHDRDTRRTRVRTEVSWCTRLIRTHCPSSVLRVGCDGYKPTISRELTLATSFYSR